MITISVKFQYIDRFLPTNRHRKLRDLEQHGTCEISVAEPAAEKFPVAFIETEYKSLYPGAKTSLDIRDRKNPNVCQSISEEIRTYSGNLYRPVRVSWGTAISDCFEGLEYLTDQLSPRDKYVNDNSVLFSDRSTVVSSTKQDQIRMIRHWAEKYVWFDGKVWERTSEPRYVVMTFGLGHNHGGTAAFIEHYYNDNIPASNYFNALQREEAVAYGKEVALRRGDTDYVDGMFDRIDIQVQMPEMVKVDSKSQHGDGDPFLNKLHALTENSTDATEAGLLAIMATAAEIAQ